MAKFPDYKIKLVSELIPYANNSRTHSDNQVSQVSGSIKEFGFTLLQYFIEFGIIPFNNKKGIK